MFRVVQRVWVARFYEQNAALLLLVFFVMFGLVEAGQLWQYHVSLVYGTLGSLALMGLVALAWALYMFRSLYFLAMALRQPHLSFLFEVNKLSQPKRFGIILYGQMLTQVPVYLYSIFMVALAVYSKSWMGLAFVVGMNLVLLVLACYWINRLLTTVHVPIWSWPVLLPRWNKPVPYVWFYLGWVKNQHTLAWLLTKLFSGIAIVLFLQIETEGYDYRPAALGLCLALTGHTVLIAEMRKLEEQYLYFIKALPVRKVYRYANLGYVYALLILPELIVLAFHGLTALDWIGLLILGTGSMLFWHANLYRPIWTMDKHIRTVIITYLISFIIVLSGGYWIIALVLSASSLILFLHNVDRYDVNFSN